MGRCVASDLGAFDQPQIDVGARCIAAGFGCISAHAAAEDDDRLSLACAAVSCAGSKAG